MLRIPITMCHGTARPGYDAKLTVAHFEALVSIAAEMGFESINYDALAAWREGTAALPERPIMFDFDHPVVSMRVGVSEVLAKHDETYMPKEVADALRKSGQWREGEATQ